jgi:hypothetical protein
LIYSKPPPWLLPPTWSFPPNCVIPTFYDRVTSESHDQLLHLVKSFGELVLPPVPKDTKCREATRYGQTLWEYAPDCRALQGFVNGSGDPAGGYSRLPRNERRQKASARRKAKQRLPGRVNWDLPLVKQRVVELAEQHGVPASQLASLLLLHALDELEQGQIDVDHRKRPSDSPRYHWNLDFSDFEV